MIATSATGPDLFYPLVPDWHWIPRLASLGVRSLQLRFKGDDDAAVEMQVREGVAAAKAHGIQLIINDYWAAAIRHGASDIHLGQEDLAVADLDAIKAAGLRIGISTHSEAELELALAADPAYVALGPIYETKLKKMKWSPQGLDRIRQWRARIGDLPLVAIGGLTPERAQGVIEAGASSVAVITNIFADPEPDARVALWVDWAERLRG
jgi:thiamine-phosphate pyrophosphorylase